LLGARAGLLVDVAGLGSVPDVGSVADGVFVGAEVGADVPFVESVPAPVSFAPPELAGSDAAGACEAGIKSTGSVGRRPPPLRARGRMRGRGLSLSLGLVVGRSVGFGFATGRVAGETDRGGTVECRLTGVA
jgi:hypothetical protein